MNYTALVLGLHEFPDYLIHSAGTNRVIFFGFSFKSPVFKKQHEIAVSSKEDPSVAYVSTSSLKLLS